MGSSCKRDVKWMVGSFLFLVALMAVLAYIGYDDWWYLPDADGYDIPH